MISVLLILSGSVFAKDWCPAPCNWWFCDDPWFCNCGTNDCGGGCCGWCDTYDYVGIRCGGFCIDSAIQQCCWKGSCDLGGCPHSSDREVAWNISHYSCCNFNSIWLRGHKPDADWKCTTATVFDNTEIMDGISGAIYSHTNGRGDVGNALVCWDFSAGARVCGDDACYNINTQECWAGGDVRSNNGGPCVNGSTDCVSGICCAGVCTSAAAADADGDGHISDQCIGDIPGGRGDDCNDSEPLIYTGHDEECDCLDNDCDGLTDGADPDINTTPTRPACTALGVCIGHKKLCVDTIPGPGCAAAWVDCDAPDYSNPETGWGNCDGKDNDCDGLTDADDPDLGAGPPCTNLGVCIGHNKLCVGGMWIDCDAPGYENPEVSCDGEDNDCNGQWDEPCDCDDAKPTCELAPPKKDCRDALCIGTPGNSCWSVGGEISATTCCGDDPGEFYSYYDQAEVDGCNDITDEPCVGKDDNLSDNACCDNETDCVFNDRCYPTDNLTDLDGDGVDGEVCVVSGGKGKWMDCDDNNVLCEGSCSFMYIPGEAGTGEYDFTGAVECCGDDFGEYYVHYDQLEFNGCNDTTDERCVGKDDDPSDNACCDNETDCVFNHLCYSIGNLTDIDMDTVNGELCVLDMGKGKWMDCDDSQGVCTTDCSSIWIWGGESDPFGEYDRGTDIECCGDDIDEHYNYYDQLEFNGCNDITDERCVGRDDNPLDNACCDNANDCVFGRRCYSTNDLIDVDGDGVNGEVCKTGKWLDCDDSNVVCTTDCSLVWIAGGEPGTPFGEYDTGTSTECCGDDFGEYYVGGTDGTYACCDNRDSAMMPLFGDECVIGGVCQDRTPSPEICNDGEDNDCDGDTDFADLDCVSCALGYRCDACSGWVTKDPGHAPCAPPYNGCVRDSGVGYYDWACCEGVICKIEKETHL